MATNTVTDGLAAGKSILDFALDVYDRVLRRLCVWGARRRDEGRPDRELRDKFGEWANEARDSMGRWQQPVLKKEAFERHLDTLKIDNETPRPLVECTSSFNWAKLLYALQIRPKQGREEGIIEWRQIPENQAASTNITLLIHSSAICHLINLYQINTGLAAPEAQSFNFVFGKLKVLEKLSHMYSFESLGNPRAAPKFFPYRLRDETGLREGNLFPESALAIDSYLMALNEGISNKALNLNETSKSPLQRAELLLKAMDLLTKRDWAKPYLITQSWIVLATRICQRATTDGGKNRSLQRHIVDFIARDASVVKSLQKPLQNEGDWKSLLETTVKAFFMFDDDESSDKYEFIWNLQMQLSSAKNQKFTTIVTQQLLPALEGLAETTEGEIWRRTATEILPAETLLRVFKIPHRIVNQPVVIIHHIPDQWEFYGQIID